MLSITFFFNITHNNGVLSSITHTLKTNLCHISLPTLSNSTILSRHLSHVTRSTST
ncbi:hypothetical protein Hanom_Chr00s050387g01779661 [Helianthus anomalus]